ncbi:MAG TPA: patatin-like phospholipase family protein, partial [Actinopolymorphaceae bacterium]
DRPSRPALGLGSPALLWSIVRQPWAYSLPTLLAAILPRGRGPMGSILELVDQVLPAWPKRPVLGLCAMDFETGERRVFGPSDSGIAPAVAVNASCALPAWFAPVTVEGRTYVDGGSYSFTSVDVAAGRGLDEVYVFAPLAHVVRGFGQFSISHQLLRWWRLPQTKRMWREVETLRAEGTTVRVIAPSAEDIAELGLNPMADTNRVTVLETAIRTYQRSTGNV